MARGTPDWGWIDTSSPVSVVTDIGELAVRLGSIDRFSRSGQVLMLEDFRHGLSRWASILSGAGAVADLTLVSARSGRFSARLVGGSDASRYAGVFTNSPVPGTSPSALEVSFAIAANVDRVEIAHRYNDPANLWSFRLRYDHTNSQLLYYNSGGTYTVLDAALSLAADPTLFHTVKIVADLANGKYVRAFVDDTAYSLAGVAGYSAAIPNSPFLSPLVIAYSRAGQNDTVYLDDVILTQNEPA